MVNYESDKWTIIEKPMMVEMLEAEKRLYEDFAQGAVDNVQLFAFYTGYASAITTTLEMLGVSYATDTTEGI